MPLVAGQLTLVSGQLDLRARKQRLARTETASRASVLRALIQGDLQQARRLIAPLLPTLLSTLHGEISVLEVPASDDRCAAAAEVDQALDWEALTIIWPSDSRRVIICRPRAHGGRPQPRSC